MNINKIDNTNFQAIYKIPYSERNFLLIKDKIIPTYKVVSNQKADFFMGSHPLKMALIQVIEKIVKELDCSLEWLKANAKNHGAKEGSMDLDSICVITSQDDINAIGSFIRARIDKAYKEVVQANSFLYKVKNFFLGKEEEDLGFNEKTPEHLRKLFYSIKNDKIEAQAFEEAFPKVVLVKNTDELLLKMLNER